MNESIFSTIGWCILQVSLVALAGIILSQLFARRHPFAACTIVSMSAVVAAMLTCLAPFPAHRWFVHERLPAAIEKTIAEQNISDRTAAIRSSETTKDAFASDSMFELRDLALAVRAISTTMDLTEYQSSPVVTCVSWLLLAIIAVSLIRLIIGIIFVEKLRRSGIPISDSQLTSLVHELAAELNCRTIPDIRESHDFADAAVAGWLRPTLILPAEWRRWNLDEQRAVLAHELAHIVRQDIVWRTVASSVLALHCYNPLVHWLLRRVMLYQEISADAVAVITVGQQRYLRSLSSLAIRRDDQMWRSVSPDVLPVFSGQLIKRINVLTSREGRIQMKNRCERSVTSAMIFTAFLVLGVAALAVRGLAQQPLGDQRAATNVIQTTSFGSIIHDEIATPDPTQGMFNRSPLDASIVGNNNRFGMVAFRVNESLSRPESRAWIPALNGYLSATLASDLKMKSPPAIHCENIQWIAARPKVVFTAKKKDERAKLMFGAGGFVMKLTQPLNLTEWVEQHTPELKRHSIEGVNVYEFAIRTLGPIPVYVWMEDETTIRTSIAVKNAEIPTKLSDLGLDPPNSPGVPAGSPANFADAERESRWKSIWNRIDGGLISVFLANLDVNELLQELDNNQDVHSELELALARPYRGLLSRCASYAVSFDLANGVSQFGTRASFIHSSLDDAAKSAQDMRDLLAIAKTELEKKETAASENVTPIEKRLLPSINEALRRTIVKVNENADGTADVVVSIAVPFSTITEFFAAEYAHDQKIAKEPTQTEQR